MSYFVRTFKSRKAFLDALEEGDSISAAALLAGGRVRDFNKWRNEDKDFANDWDEAIEAGTDTLEDIAVERAKRKSDPLMIMMLKARRPDKYDRAVKSNVEVSINVEGSKAKLLNKIARLNAQRGVSDGSSETGSDLPSQEEEDNGPRLLPPPSAGDELRGSKRRAATGQSGRQDNLDPAPREQRQP